MMKTGKGFQKLVPFQRCGVSRGEILLLLFIMSHQFKVVSQAVLESERVSLGKSRNNFRCLHVYLHCFTLSFFPFHSYHNFLVRILMLLNPLFCCTHSYKLVFALYFFCAFLHSLELSRRELKLLEKCLEGKSRFSRKQKYLAIRPDCYRMLGESVGFQGNSSLPFFPQQSE